MCESKKGQLLKRKGLRQKMRHHTMQLTLCFIHITISMGDPYFSKPSTVDTNFGKSIHSPRGIVCQCPLYTMSVNVCQRLDAFGRYVINLGQQCIAQATIQLNFLPYNQITLCDWRPVCSSDETTQWLPGFFPLNYALHSMQHINIQLQKQDFPIFSKVVRCGLHIIILCLHKFLDIPIYFFVNKLHYLF